MKRNIPIVSIVLMVVGFIIARVGASLSAVDNGTVLDSVLMPNGAISFMLGLKPCLLPSFGTSLILSKVA